MEDGGFKGIRQDRSSACVRGQLGKVSVTSVTQSINPDFQTSKHYDDYKTGYETTRFIPPLSTFPTSQIMIDTHGRLIAVYVLCFNLIMTSLFNSEVPRFLSQVACSHTPHCSFLTAHQPAPTMIVPSPIQTGTTYPQELMRRPCRHAPVESETPVACASCPVDRPEVNVLDDRSVDAIVVPESIDSVLKAWALGPDKMSAAVMEAFEFPFGAFQYVCPMIPS